MSKPSDKQLLFALIALVASGFCVLAFVCLAGDRSTFDSSRFKDNPDETRLAMYQSLKAKIPKGSSKAEVKQLLGEPIMGLSELNFWTYAMGRENDETVNLVVTFEDGKVQKIQKDIVETD